MPGQYPWLHEKLHRPLYPSPSPGSGHPLVPDSGGGGTAAPYLVHLQGPGGQ